MGLMKHMMQYYSFFDITLRCLSLKHLISVQVTEFENIFSKLVNEPQMIDELIQKGKSSINDSISNIGNSSKILFHTLNEL